MLLPCLLKTRISTASSATSMRPSAAEYPTPGWVSFQSATRISFAPAATPTENGYIESFNGRLRDECLNVEVFFTLADVRDKLERWRHDYNQVRPHSALADHPPETFAAQWAETAAPVPEPVPAQAGKPATGNSLEPLT